MTPDRFTLLIGAMKAGTTSLFHYLTQHPQIAGSRDKEPAFFAREDVHAKGFDWYVDLWPDYDENHRTALEATSAYSKRPRFMGVPERIRRVEEEQGVEFDVLYILRDPLDRIHSHRTHALAGQREDQHHLHGIRRGSMEGHTLEVSMYARQIDAYLEHFDRERLKLLRFEAFVDDHEQVLREVEAFLGLDRLEDPTPPGEHNVTVGKYEAGHLWRFTEETGLVRLADPLPESIKAPLRDLLGDEIDEKAEMSDELEAFYLDALARDVERLRDEHGFDVDAWPTADRLGI